MQKNMVLSVEDFTERKKNAVCINFSPEQESKIISLFHLWILGSQSSDCISFSFKRPITTPGGSLGVTLSVRKFADNVTAGLKEEKQSKYTRRKYISGEHENIITSNCVTCSFQ